MKVIVLTGGTSTERQVALSSAKNVVDALKRLNYEVETYDLKDGLEKLEIGKDTLVFPVLHGKEGEGGDLQQELEKRGIKFIGSGSKALKKGWDKVSFKFFCAKENILTPKWEKLTKENFENLNLDFPLIIKPTDGGSSIDLFLVDSSEELININFKGLFEKYEVLLAEEYVRGIEVTCGVLGNEALPVLEIIPPNGEMFDYNNKYNGKTKEIPFAPSVSKELQEKVQQITLEIHTKLGCKDLSRTDFIIKGKDIYVLEINTIPGLTSESLVPKEAKAAGMSFEEMIQKLILFNLR